MRLRAIRFSLRTLLIVMAVAPVAMYWVGLPTLNARRYVAALEAKDYVAADRMCVDQQHPFPGEMKEWLSFAAQVKVERLTCRDVWRGQRRIAIYYQAHMGSVVGAFAGFEAVATRKGIVFPPEKDSRPGIELPKR
jgi:hypothetical protein